MIQNQIFKSTTMCDGSLIVHSSLISRRKRYDAEEKQAEHIGAEFLECYEYES